jgi:uncharacterized RDD family membrane protein YckC
MQVWIGRNGERFGPYPEEEVRLWLRDGTCRPEEMGWYEGMTDWRPMGELFPEDRPAPNTPPPIPPTGQPAAQPFMGINEDVVPEYAGFWLRVGAWVIDYILITVPTTILAFSLGLRDAASTLMRTVETDGMTAMVAYAEASRPYGLATLLIGFAYYAVFEASKWQATPGKLAVGIRVTDLNGQRVSLGRAAGRNLIRLGTLVPVIGLFLPLVFYVTSAFSERKQGVHDMLANTYVLTGRTDTGASPAPRDRAGGTGGHGGSFDA